MKTRQMVKQMEYSLVADFEYSFGAVLASQFQCEKENVIKLCWHQRWFQGWYHIGFETWDFDRDITWPCSKRI